MKIEIDNPTKRRMFRDSVAIRSQLRTTEALGDEFLGQSFELGKRMLAARSHPDATPHIGQAAIIRLVNAQKAMVDASNHLFRVHDELSKVGVAVGVVDTPGTTPPSALDEIDEQILAVPIQA
ncbi:MAG: hypothetical protein WA957_00625 [Alteraurantiacibacter sp.]